MDFERFNELILKIHAGGRLDGSERTWIREGLPELLPGPRAVRLVREYPHPAGLKISGAPAGSFLRAYALLLGRKALGRDEVIDHPLFSGLENEITIELMRSNFEFGRPKGFYCCRTCSMAVFPLLEQDCLRYLSGRDLARQVRPRIEARDPVYTRGLPARLVEFSLSF